MVLPMDQSNRIRQSFWQLLKRMLGNRYEPSRHYMRGPGPKSRAAGAVTPSSSISATSGLGPGSESNAGTGETRSRLPREDET